MTASFELFFCQNFVVIFIPFQFADRLYLGYLCVAMTRTLNDQSIK